jgi:hypothetical protein
MAQSQSTHVCAHCGREFTPNSPKQRFCTKSCGALHRTYPNQAAVVNVCPQCGGEFTPTYSHRAQQFCSRLCSSHAIPRGPKPTLPELRFWPKVNRNGPVVWEGHGQCWLWDASIGDGGYGNGLRVDGKHLRSHVYSYLLHYGASSIPDGWEIDHLCRNRECCRPDHLEAVPSLENQRRGLAGDLRTHCIHGHPFDEANTYYRKGTHERMCRACAAERERQRQQRLREKSVVMQ